MGQGQEWEKDILLVELIHMLQGYEGPSHGSHACQHHGLGDHDTLCKTGGWEPRKLYSKAFLCFVILLSILLLRLTCFAFAWAFCWQTFATVVTVFVRSNSYYLFHVLLAIHYVLHGLRKLVCLCCIAAGRLRFADLGWSSSARCIHDGAEILWLRLSRLCRGLSAKCHEVM